MLDSAQLSEEAWRVNLNTKRDGPFGFDALNCPLKDRSLEKKERVGELLPAGSFTVRHVTRRHRQRGQTRSHIKVCRKG